MNRHSLIGKLAAIGLVVAALWCASLMVLSLVRERGKTREIAVKEITKPWGGPQTMVGPFLAIPYAPVAEGKGDRDIFWYYQYILPEQLDISCVVNPETRRRNLFEAVTYTSQIHVTGHFSLPDLRRPGMPGRYISLREAQKSARMSTLYNAYFVVGASSEYSIKGFANLLFNSSPIKSPGEIYHNFHFISSATAVPVVLPPRPEIDPSIGDQPFDIPFSFDIELSGSELLKFAPLGQHTSISMRSRWAQPMFIGQYPPAQFNDNGDEFSAHWSVADGSYLPHSLSETRRFDNLPALGVKFFNSLDGHRKVERVSKYAALFILFTFAAFFIAEVKNSALVHPIQYLMVGGAIVIFYLLLLSISEHAGFTVAYLISSLATMAIIALYAWAALHSSAFAAVVGALLFFLYGYFYMTTQMEDYALLAGSLALFIILAAVMYYTRKVNWYRLGNNIG